MVNLKGRLASRKADSSACASETPDFGKDFLTAHHDALREIGIAERAAEIAKTEADEDHWKARPPAFSLKGIEYFVNLI